MKPIAHPAACLAAATLSLSACLCAQAAPPQGKTPVIDLSGTVNGVLPTNVSGNVGAGVEDYQGTTSPSDNLSKNKPVASATATGLGSTSSTTGALLGNSFTFSLTQTFAPSDFTTFGDGKFDFTAAMNGMYAIGDGAPAVDLVDSGDQLLYQTYLTDLTTGAQLYDDQSGSVSGLSSASLSAGDNYEFGTSASLGGLTDPTLTYDPSITFTSNATPTSVTPEPSSFVLLGTGLLGIAGARKRRLL